MRSTNLVLILTMLASLMFSASGQDLAGNEWTIAYLRGASPAAEAFMKFDQAANRFTGNTGCNIMNGAVRMTRSSISFSSVITTKRACTRITAPTESKLLSALGRVDRYRKSGPKIQLYSGKQLLIELSPRYITPEEPEQQPVADQIELESRKWVLETIGGVEIPKVKEQAFIVFDPVKKSAGGNSSCNVFGGSYETDGSKITISETISTMRACVEDERMNIERQFFDALKAVDRYEIKGLKLTLYRANKQLLTFIGTKQV